MLSYHLVRLIMVSCKVPPPQAANGKFDSYLRFYIKADVILKSVIEQATSHIMDVRGGAVKSRYIDRYFIDPKGNLWTQQHLHQSKSNINK